MKKILIISVIIYLAIVPVLSGCGDSTPVETFVVSNQQLSDQSSIEIAAKTQQDELASENDIYACVSFIESPKGMKYTVHWIQSGQTIKTEDKEMVTEPRGVIVYTLEKDKLRAGDLKVQILYKDEVLAEKEVTVK